MPTLTEAMTGLAHSIARHRRERAEATRARVGEFNDRASAIATELAETRAAREAAGREYQAAANARLTQLRDDTDTFIASRSRVRLGTHRAQMERAAAQRDGLATFMSDLTGNVGSMRDRFRSELDTLSTEQGAALASFMTTLTSDVGTLRAGFRADLDEQRADLAGAARALHQVLDEAGRDRQGATDAWRGTKPTPPVRPAAAKSAAPKAEHKSKAKEHVHVPPADSQVSAP